MTDAKGLTPKLAGVIAILFGQFCTLTLSRRQRDDAQPRL